ncbi:hypothetical protein K491DRAFT_414680 [Lophiostoma macrostomum CBS 122681]|uniref:Uncharacterized protein n=1 Tax=Lophiostoma macrostomum CBS 122681 TaxID=1314788 RepID=A0A6A6T8V9_9PLEO|nr:hypothetical protein K491DRAFT_414680 [Lophiostoma macrostomum CBS 122681]
MLSIPASWTLLVLAISMQASCDEDEDDHHLSKGAIVGIGVGAGIGGALLIGLSIYLFVWGVRRSKTRQQAQTQNVTDEPSPHMQIYGGKDTALAEQAAEANQAGKTLPEFDREERKAHDRPKPVADDEIKGTDQRDEKTSFVWRKTSARGMPTK